MQKVIIDIENGTITVKVEGIKGKGCKAITADLEKELGEVKHTKATHEMNQLAASHGKPATR